MSNNQEFPSIGHNSGDEAPAETSARDVGGIAGQRLKSFIERIERIEEEESHLKEDKKEVYAEASGIGFDKKIIRKVVKLRAMDAEKRREDDELLDLYKSAVGLV